jgi:hypothetical protein
MFDHKHYVPILKVKAGELAALDTASHKGQSFTPLMEVIRVDQTLVEAATAIRRAWQIQNSLFADTFYVEQGPPFGETAIEVLGAAAQSIGLRIIPVTGLGRTQGQKDATASGLLPKS